MFAFPRNARRGPDENDSISFAWDFQAVGTVDSIDPNPSHTYTANGVYDIPYSVTVTDPEDGAIDCSRVNVTFVLVHDQHGHGERGQRRRAPGTAPVGVGDVDAAGEIAAVDAQHVVQLRRQHVEYVQSASGLQFSGIAAPETDPLGAGQAANQIDNGDWLALNNRYSFDAMDKQITFRFANNQAAGSLRGLVDVRLDAVDGPSIATCELRATGNNGVYTSQTCPFTGAVSGSHRIYLTFRQAPGGPATGFGLLHWVEFSGPGITAP